MKHRYVAPSDSSAEALAVIDEMNALRRRAEAMGERLRARMASNAVQR